ncbi:MAG: type II toxin-antitoxin system HicB family antitoxin [Bacteroidales bacterium]|nr:type II toxin-antitoxin system HicB family antitoxin [Bacteroidales bacterium]
MKKILIIVEKGGNGLYSVYSPNTEFTVLNGQGATVEDAIADMKEALQEVIESYQESGEGLPAELTGNMEFEFKYDVASLFNHFDEINLSSFARKNGMNESLLRKYKNGLAFASEKQCRKIENGLHRLGQSLCAASL